MSKIKAKAIIPKKLNKRAMVGVLEDVVEETIEESDDEFAKTYKNWKDPPDFEQELQSNKNKIVGSTTTDPEGSRDNPYPFVTKGTRVRYATMTSDFKAKTKPGVIGSGGGAGGVLVVDTRRPRPGIEAREFEPAIAKIEQPKFEKRGKKAESKLAKVSGHKI